MEKLKVLIKTLIRETTDRRAQLLVLVATLSKSSARDLAELRVGEVDARIRAQGFVPGFTGEMCKLAGRLSKGRDPQEYVVKGRNAGGRVPVSRVTIWRLLKVVMGSSSKILRGLQKIAKRVRDAFMSATSKALESLSEPPKQVPQPLFRELDLSFL